MIFDCYQLKKGKGKKKRIDNFFQILAFAKFGDNNS